MNFLELTKKRYSVRKYDAEREIPRELLEYVMECANMAPSAVNFQPAHFYVVRSEELRKKIVGCTVFEWLQSAPYIIVACVDHSKAWHRRKYDGKDHADIDLAIAAEHLCLAAAEQGLGTCWVCHFDAQKCHEVMGLDDNVECAALIPIGYPDDKFLEKKRNESNYELI